MEAVGRLRLDADLRLLQSPVAPLGAYAEALAGRAPEAAAILKGFVDSKKQPAIAQHRDLAYLADATRRAGGTEDALEIAQRALVRARVDERHGQEAHLLRILGDTYAAIGRDADAIAHYGDGLALAEPRGMRPLIAHCHLGLGKLYARTDKRYQAQEHLHTATTLYREMGMTYWLENADAEMPELG